MSELVVGLGLVFFIEGLMFLAFPTSAKRGVAHILATPDRALRIMGLIATIAGLALVWLVKR